MTQDVFSMCLIHLTFGVLFKGKIKAFVHSFMGCRNVIQDVVFKSVPGMAAFTQCLFAKIFNCGQRYGKVWTHMYSAFYNTSGVNKVWSCCM